MSTYKRLLEQRVRYFIDLMVEQLGRKSLPVSQAQEATVTVD